MFFQLGGYDYDADSGRVDTVACHSLNSGLQSTGEYQTFDNRLDPAPLDIKKQFTVTESSSSSIAFSENVELSNGTTITAGTDAANVSDTLSETFGVSKSSTKDTSTETAKSLELDLTVPAHASFAVAGGTHNSATDCQVHIDAVADWSSIKVSLHAPVPPGTSGDDTWDDICHAQPTTASNLCGVLRSGGADLVHGLDHHVATMTFSESDAIYRAALGYDVRCPNCGRLLFSSQAHAALAELALDATRHITFDGVRHSTSDDDATYQIIDVTSHSDACVSQVLGATTQPLSSISQRLDACDA